MLAASSKKTYYCFIKTFLQSIDLMQKSKIVVIDFGGQYAHLICRRIRQLNVFSEILEPTVSLNELKNANGIILSGGPSSVYDENAPVFNEKIFETKIPILGLCYGHQLMAKALGGKVTQGKLKEYGTAEFKILNKKSLFAGLKPREIVWMSHGDFVEKVPNGFDVIGSTENCKNAAIANFGKKFFGLQFHPEVTHTLNGMLVLKNFVFKICGCRPDWTMKNYIPQKISEIRRQAGGKNVLILVSGGVDSAVALALLAKALPEEKIYALHIDTGFMRKNETKNVEIALKKLGLGKLHVVNASTEFFDALNGIIEPEQKRKIIGELFLKIKDREIKRLNLNPDEWLLCQGTIYPDTIESKGTKNAAKIKTHHNRVESILELIELGKIVEPLNQLYKDEVRNLGEKLGLPKKFVQRHPFPGPGLAIRAICSDGITGNSIKELTEMAKLLAKNFEFNARVLPIQSVGVQGDSRSYGNCIALWGKLNWKKLEECSTKLTNELHEINRCVYMVLPNELNSAKLQAKTLTEKRIQLLQEADEIAMKAIAKHKLLEKIWQFPTVLIPIAVNADEAESIVLRPVESLEAMTAKFYPMNEKILKEIAEKIMKLNGISAVFYDITHKPPATIEWE